jgi:WD40 repeat protein
MALSAGTRLGPYEVVELLGAGGMGEVYRARDPRLGRDVAVKVLPEEVAQDAQRLGFFEREARAVAALNHPNILTVHDVGTHEGVPYVVTELLEGENLRQLDSRRSPTVKQVLGYALQAARGLEAAHAKGIVHRDLKPENLFLTTDGRVKVLDFGLAKLVHREEVSRDETTPSRLTGSGQVLGTVSYMSPEQARGHPVDARADVFSFGVVLYELLAQRHPFRRDTAAATLAAIMQETPAGLESLSRGIPPAVGGIIRRCLEKGKEDRYASGHEVAVALETVLAAPTGAAALLEVEERSPYPGLSSFTEKDAGVFFGREEEIEAVWGKLKGRQLLAVIGPSGVGKTSVVRAGVIASRPEGWAAVHATPGSDPALALAQALTPELVGDADAMKDLLQGVAALTRTGEVERVVGATTRWRSRHAEALLVMDQFEELFTLNPPEVQERFAALLGRLASDADVHVVLSLRDDFLIRCSDHKPLAPVFESLTPLTALSREGLRRAVVEPAKTNGYRFEDEALVEEMVSAVEGSRGALPLLAFAVARLWEKRDRERKRLTREAYQEIGGVEGALGQHAEATMDRIGSERQGLVREIFRNLVTAQGTRAVMDKEELLSAFPERDAAAEVLGQLIDARLLTSYQVEGKQDEPSRHRIEVVHESLLSAWPRLVRWQTQDEEGALLRDQLKQAAHLWNEKSRSPDLLWSGTAFREFELWRERYPGKLTALEEEFSDSMVHQARRRRRIRRLVTASVVAVAVIVASVTGVLWRRSEAARRRAEAEVRQREAAQILSLGRLRLEGHPTAALAHALASLERADNEPARLFAVQALWKGPTAHVLADASNPCLPVWSPDGQWLAVGGTAGLLLLDRDGDQHRLLEAKNAFPTGFSADGTRLVTSEEPNILRLWALPEVERLETWTLHWAADGTTNWWEALVDRRLLIFEVDDADQVDRPFIVRERSIDGGPERVLGRWPREFDINPRGEWLVSIEDGRLLRRRLDSMEAPPRVVGRHEGGVTLRVRPWTDRIATADATGEIRVWDADTGRLERTLRSPADARGLSLDPSGRYLAAAPRASGGLPPRSFYVFDLEGPRGADPVALLNDEINALNGMSFHPDGLLLASGHYPHGILLWNLAAPRSITLRGLKGPFIAVAFAPDGRLVATSLEGVVRLWPLWAEPDAQVRELWSRPGVVVGNFDVSLDGRFAVVLDRNAGQVIVLPLDGSAGAVHEVNGVFPMLGRGLAPDGHRVALAGGQPEVASIRILDLETGELRTLRVEDTAGVCVYNPAGPIQFPLWLPDGRLVSEGALGLRLWDIDDGSSRQLRACRDMESEPPYLAATPDSGTVLALFDPRSAPGETSTLTAFELATGTSREISDHGTRVSAFALDPTGTILVTGDGDGLVRVGPLSGGEPHLLYGHAQAVTSLAVSPDGRWIASASDDETIRLWPMPDLSQPPLHALTYEELLSKLRSLTNLRVVPDPDSATGYKLEAGPFPGWREIPTW